MLSLHPAGPVLPPDSSPLEQCLLLEWGGVGGYAPQGHWAKSGDTFGCCNRGGLLMVSGRQRPDVPLNFLQCSEQPLTAQDGLA